jgi:hypothetical protein
MTRPTPPAAPTALPATPIATQLILAIGNSLSPIAEFPGIHLQVHVNSVITMASTRYRVHRVPDFGVAPAGAETPGLVTQMVYVTEDD